MEHWSHGLDILEAAGVEPVDTDRLKPHRPPRLHHARLRLPQRAAWSLPDTPLYVELDGALGRRPGRWGPADAPDRIFGSAGDFCRVVTQRIHHLDTALRCEGTRAREFLEIAQAFAGPSGAGRPPKTA